MKNLCGIKPQFRPAPNKALKPIIVVAILNNDAACR